MTQRTSGAYTPEEIRRACEEHHDVMFLACYRVLRNRPDAAEAVNEAVVNALRNPPRQLVRSFEGWLRTVAVNAARDLIRGKERHRKLVMKAMRNFRDAPVDNTGNVQLRTDVERLVERALGFLTETQRQNFVLFRAVAAGELTDAELAGELGITPVAVRARRDRVRKIAVAAVKLACLTNDPGNRCGEPVRLTASTPEPRLHKALREHVATCATCRHRLAADSTLIRTVLAAPPVAFVADLIGTHKKAVTATVTAATLVAVVITLPHPKQETPPPGGWAVPVKPVPRPLPPPAVPVPTATPEVPLPAPPPPPAPAPPPAGAAHNPSPATISNVWLEYHRLSTDGESCDEATTTGIVVASTGAVASMTAEVHLRDRVVRVSLGRAGDFWYGEIGPFPAGDADQRATVVVVGDAAVTAPGGDLLLTSCEDG